MTVGPRVALAILSALATASTPRLSAAAESTPAPSARSVELLVIGDSARQKWLEDLLGPRSAAGAKLNISRADQFEPRDVLGAAPSANATLYCWVDLRAATRARIYFSARAGKRFLLRDVELSGAFDELDRESLSQVLTSSWSALFEDEQLGLSREETATLLAKRAENAPAAVVASAHANPTEPSSPELAAPAQAVLVPRIALFYSVQTLSNQLWATHGPGLAVSGARHGRRYGLALWLAGQFRFPETERDSRIGVQLESVATRAGLELRWPVQTDFANAQHELAVRAGVGLDFTHLSPRTGSVDASAALTPSRWTTELAFTSSFRASMRVTRHAALGLALFVDILPRLAVYELRTDAGPDRLLSPWHVRPGVALEVETR